MHNDDELLPVLSCFRTLVMKIGLHFYIVSSDSYNCVEAD